MPLSAWELIYWWKPVNFNIFLNYTEVLTIFESNLFFAMETIQICHGPGMTIGGTCVYCQSQKSEKRDQQRQC